MSANLQNESENWNHKYSNATEIYSFNDAISNIADIPAHKVIKFRNALVSTKQEIWIKIHSSDLSSEEVLELYGWSSAMKTIIDLVDAYLLEVDHES